MTNRMTNKAIFFAAFALVFAVAMTLALAPAKTDTVYADGTTYYLVGTMNDWTTSDAYVLTKNNEAVGEEYYIDIDLTYPELVGNGGAQFKVVSNNNVWYPGGENNNYTINKVGNYRVYFRPNGDGGDGWHYNVIYVERKASTFHRGTINVSELRTDDYLQPDEGMLYVYVDVARWNFYWVNTADGDSMSARQDYYNGETVEIPFGYRYRMDMYGDPGLPDYLWGCRYGYWDFSDDCIVKWDDGVVRVYPKPEGVQGGPGNGTMYDYDEDISPEWAGICNQTYKIVFEEGVTHVGNRSFRMYGNLREIVFASTVTSIGSEAFAYSGLTTLNIPDTVRSVGNYAFEYNTSLKGGTFPCASVGEGVFMCCSALTDLDWLDGVKSIGSGAFLGCTGLVDVTLPASITSIGSGAFGRCSNLERIHLPNGLTSIPSGIVGKCDKLTEVIIGANVSYIDHGAFEGCNASFYFVVPGEPHDVTIENGYVGGGGFAFPDGAVPHYIYEEGVSHEDIYLYSVVERIVEGRQNFLHSNNNAYSRTFNWRNKNRLLAYNSGDCEVVLADIDFAGKITVKPRTDGGEGNDGSGQMGDATDYNPLGCWPVLPVTQIVVEDGVTSIGSHAFDQCSDAVNITIGKDVKKIGSYAFLGCGGLKTIDMPDGLEVIENAAFYRCASLESITIPAGQTSIGDDTFFGCSSLTEVILPAGLKSIGVDAFYLCSSLKEITIPKTVTFIGGFGACPATLYLERPDEEADLSAGGPVRILGTGDMKLFNDETGDEVKDGGYISGLNHWRLPHDYESGDCIVNVWGPAITVSKKVGGNGTGAMADYAELEDRPWHFRATEYRTVVVEEGVTHIGNKAFTDLIYIKSVTLSEGLTTIGAEVFKGLDDLESITIPSTVRSLGDDAFWNAGFYIRFVRPELNNDCNTLTIGEKTFRYQRFYYANSGSMYLCNGRTEMIDALTDLGQSPATYTWRPYQHEIRVASNDYQVTASIGNESPAYYAAAGEQVVLSITGSDIPSFYVRKMIRSIQDVVDLIGDNVIEKDNGVVKVVDGKLVLMIDGNVVETLTDDYTVRLENLSYHPSSLNGTRENYYFECEGKNSWEFKIENDSLYNLKVYNDVNNIFNSNNYLDIGFLKESSLELTNLGNGQYTFTMPDNSIRIGSGNVIKSVVITITNPVANEALPTKATTQTPSVIFSNIDWSPASSSGIADYDTAYTAEFVALITGEYVFTAQPTITVNGKVANVRRLSDTMVRVTFTFDATEVNSKTPATVTSTLYGKYLYTNGAAQELIAAGEAEGGTMQYALGLNNTNEPLTGWSTSIPTGFNAGTYYVWYKAVGDSTHSDSKAVCVITRMSLNVLTTGAYSDLVLIKNYDLSDEENVAIANSKKVNFNGHKWYVIEDYSTSRTEGTITLFLAEDSLGSTYFSNNGTAYCNANVKSILDAMTTQGGLFAGVSKAIANTELNDVCVTDAKLYLLSAQEANGISWFTDGDCLAGWWLRTPGQYSNLVSCYDVSYLDDMTGPSSSYGIRPALRLDLSKVTFDSETKTFVIHEHNADILEYVEAKEPTACIEGNIAYYRCPICGKLFSDEHGENEITIESTIIPILGHDIVHHDGKEPTCTESGWAPYDTCSLCDYTTYKELPALGHRWGKWTDNGDGTETHHCRFCDASETRNKPTSFSETIETNKQQNEYIGGFAVITVDHPGYSEGASILMDQYKMIVSTNGQLIPKVIFYVHEDTTMNCEYSYVDKGNLTISPDNTCIIVDSINSDSVVLNNSRLINVYKVEICLPSPDDITKIDAVAPTCTDAGNIDYWYDGYNDLYYSDENGENIIELADTIIPALGHEWGEWTVVKEATLEEEGLERRVCARDANHYEERVIPKVVPHVHDYKFDSFVWDGFTAKAKYVCANDNTHVEYYDATVTSEVTTAATCTTAGVRTYTATYDGHTATKTEDVKALGHDYKFVEFVWTDYTAQAKYVCANDNTHVEYYDATVTSEVTTAATCTTAGVRTYTATYDGHTDTKTEDVDALGHDIVHHDAKAATCTEIGWKAYDTCSRCDYTTYEEIAALGHDFGEWTVVKEATLEEEGLERRVCARDANHYEERVIPKVVPHVHDYKFDSFVWTDYTAQAKYVCADDNTHVVYYDATVTSEVTTAATCTTAGVRTYTATYDGHTATKTEDVKALGHDYKFVEFVWTDYTAKAKYVCTNDNTHVEYYDATVTSEVTTAATCETKGVKTYTATYDGHTATKTEDIKALGHDYQAVVTEPTCTERGYTTHTCSHCEDSYVDTYVDALGHEWGEWTVTKEAQPGVKGEETRTCSVCGEKETREIAALPYVPTINENGEKVYEITIDVATAKDVSDVFAIAKEENGSVEFTVNADFGTVTLTFDSDAVVELGDKKVSLIASVNTQDLSSFAIDGAIVAIDVTLSGATFASGNVTVSIALNTIVPKGKIVKIYYVAEDGTKTDMNATIDGGTVTFTTNHFSTYVVAVEDAPKTPVNEFIKKGCSGSISGSAIAVFGVVMAGLMIALKKKERNE